MLVPHLVEPLAARADGRARVVLVANEEEADLVPFPLSDTARWITLGAFAADDIDDAIGDYGRAHGLSGARAERWGRIMDLCREEHGGLVPGQLVTWMGPFREKTRQR